MAGSDREFGIKYGLLKENSGMLFPSDHLLQNFSTMIRNEINDGHSSDSELSELWEKTLILATFASINPDEIPEEDLKKFLRQDIGPPLANCLLSLGERAGCLTRDSDAFLIEESVHIELFRRLQPILDPTGDQPVRRTVLRQASELVRSRLSINDPENAGHSQMLALFLLKAYNLAGLFDPENWLNADSTSVN